jgi:hypothetical protein
MACLAGTTLFWPGTILDRTWDLNPRAYQALAPLGRAVGIAFLLLAVTLAVAGIGWFQRRFWGWALAVIIIVIQVFGDLLNVIGGDILRGGIGFLIAGALLLYLLRPQVRANFAGASRPSEQ